MPALVVAISPEWPGAETPSRLPSGDVSAFIGRGCSWVVEADSRDHNTGAGQYRRLIMPSASRIISHSRYPTGFRRRSVAHARFQHPRQQLPRPPSLSEPEVTLCSDFARSPRVLSCWQRLSARVRERRCHPRRKEHRHLNRRLHPRVWLRHSQGFPQLGRFRSDPQAQARIH